MFINTCKLEPAFLPENLVFMAYNFDIVNYNNNLFERLDIILPESISNSVLKRKAEFLAGRYAAKQALKCLGINNNNIPIGIHRSPTWPVEITASISHSNSIAICVASFKCHYLYLGVDIEKRLIPKDVTDIKNQIIQKSEEHLLLKSELTFEDAFTLTFSSKESLFKALYPSVGGYFDFLAVKITKICVLTHIISLVLLENLTPELKRGREFTVYFSIEDTHVFTMISE